MGFVTDETGPQVHVKQVLKQLLAAARKTNPELQTSPPPVRFGKGEAGYMNATPRNLFNEDNPNIGSINVGPAAVRDVTNGAPYALASLIHELAHLRQSADTFSRGQDYYEGGADAYSRAVAPGAIKRSGLIPALGATVPSSIGASQYQNFVNLVLSRMGRGWVMRGQFGE